MLCSQNSLWFVAYWEKYVFTLNYRVIQSLTEKNKSLSSHMLKYYIFVLLT